MSFTYKLLSMKIPEILPNDITLRTTKPKTQCKLHPATYLQLLASIVQVRKLVVIKESPAPGVQKRTCLVRLALLEDDAHQDQPFDQQAPRGPFRAQTLIIAT
jgi:hypothetical protein